MSEPSQMNANDASAIVPLKRKRGRPRKHPRPDLDRVRRAYRPRDYIPNHREVSQGAPGFSRSNQGNLHQVNPSDYMVGQPVHGIIEATFDAGYLLTVRVGNSATVLRGVVFKPGHFVPVTAGIDVAPGVQMITRNQVPLPRENYGPAYVLDAWSREGKGAVHTARASNLGPSKGKQVPSVVNGNSLGIPRGNLVPVVLQPVNLSNGGASTGTFSNATIPNQENPSNSSTPANQGQSVETQFVPFQSQHNQQEMPSRAVHQSSTEKLQEAEAKGVPFEKLPTEINKRNQVLSQSTDTNSSAANLSDDDSATASDDIDEDDEETDDALAVEPLRSVQPGIVNQPAVMSRQLENYGTGKMMQLLQVVQANMTENKVAQVQNVAANPGPKPNENEHLDQLSGR